MQDFPANDSSFASVIDFEIVQPMRDLCELLADEERVDELDFFPTYWTCSRRLQMKRGSWLRYSNCPPAPLSVSATVQLHKRAWRAYWTALLSLPTP